MREPRELSLLHLAILICIDELMILQQKKILGCLSSPTTPKLLRVENIYQQKLLFLLGHKMIGVKKIEEEYAPESHS